MQNSYFIQEICQIIILPSHSDCLVSKVECMDKLSYQSLNIFKRACDVKTSCNSLELHKTKLLLWYNDSDNDQHNISL